MYMPKYNMEEKFCDLIKRLRAEKGMSINELAEKSGLSSVEIRNIEKGNNKPHVRHLRALSEALEYNYHNLFDVLIKK